MLGQVAECDCVGVGEVNVEVGGQDDTAVVTRPLWGKDDQPKRVGQVTALARLNVQYVDFQPHFARGEVDELAPVRRPGRREIARWVARQVERLPCTHIYQIDVADS